MRSGTRWLPEGLCFYVDHCLGRRYVPEALERAGARTVVHADRFPIDHPDHEWLRECGKNGWVVLTKDGRFLPGTLEHDVIREHSVRVFVLADGNASGPEMAATFTRHLRRMASIARDRSGPFIARVTRRSVVLRRVR
ncbi:MAG: hypothetical protein IPJ77_09620 [Planctomycetes bacterium]|nr:hypothetical protein [Planctomycetota bacterium]